ncbi:1887_t:CDS:1, partial [Diversispora eburnea]
DSNDTELFGLQESFWKNVMKKMESQDTLEVGKIDDEYAKLIPILDKMENSSSKMLLAFDEAGILIDHNNSDGKDNFYHMRKALQNIPHESAKAIIFWLFLQIHFQEFQISHLPSTMIHHT